MDTYDEATLQVYDSIKRILEKYTRPENRPKPVQANIIDEKRQLLTCSKILRVNVEPKLVTITLAKLDGEIILLRIQATEKTED